MNTAGETTGREESEPETNPPLDKASDAFAVGGSPPIAPLSRDSKARGNDGKNLSLVGCNTTGPRTKEGKERSKHNAFEHGVVSEPTLVSNPIIETDFAELEDGSLVEMIEDPEKSSRTLLAIFKAGEVRYAYEHECGGQVLVPLPREREVVRHVRLPRGTMPYESVASLLREIDAVFSCCLDLEEKYRFLLASFVVSTWFIERLPVAPYVALIGLPRSGKSTVLKVLSLLCRRSLVTADITSAAFYRVCDRLTPTLLIDETGTAGDKRKLFHLLRSGISRDAVALQKDQSFHAFGAKVVSWIELPDDPALNSRCIVIPLHESKRTDLKRPTDPNILDAADDLQKQLLRYRLEKYRALNLPRIDGDTRLYSRARDLYEALALPLGQNIDACQRLVDGLKVQQDFSREPLYPPHAAVLEYLYFRLHTCGYRISEHFATGRLTGWVNEFLECEKQSFRMSPRAVGAALTALGILNRKRTGLGWEIFLDRAGIKRIHELVSRYGLEHFRHHLSTDDIQECEFCTIDDENEMIRLIKSHFDSKFVFEPRKTEW